MFKKLEAANSAKPMPITMCGSTRFISCGTSGISTSCGNSFPRDRSTAVNMSDAQRSLRRFAISKYPLFINVHFWSVENGKPLENRNFSFFP
jgi:hypothetical protein